MDNPCPTWLADPSWDNITELAKLSNFEGITMSFEQNPRDWNLWFTATQPENSQLPGGRVRTGSPPYHSRPNPPLPEPLCLYVSPGEWESNCDELQKMLVVRCLRQDRVSSCVTTFVINHLGARFVEPPVLDMKAVSVCRR